MGFEFYGLRGLEVLGILIGFEFYGVFGFRDFDGFRVSGV